MSQREAGITLNGKTAFLEAEKMKEEVAWVQLLLQERKSMKDHGSERAIC